MKHDSPSAPRPTSRVTPLLVLIVALLLSIPAGCSALRLWRRLPVTATSARFMPIEGRWDALRESLRSAPREVREAFAFQIAGRAFTGALTGSVEPARLPAAVADAVRDASQSQLGRLQQATARMRLLEHAGEPIENWWPALRVFLEGMENSRLAHFEASLIDHWARVCESLGAGPGTACDMAQAAVGNPHGPFLQFFVERIGRVIAECEHAGDDGAAETCRTVRNRLLRQWTLAPGPPGLRLLAADLLAERLDADSAGAPATRVIATDLRAWREAYRSSALERPTTILAPIRRPAPVPVEHERLVARVALTSWTGAATLLAGAIAIFLSPIWLGRGRNAIGGKRLMLRSLIATAIIVAAGVAWIHLRPESIRADLRSDLSAMRYWWLHPFVSAGLTLVVLLVVAALSGNGDAGKRAAIARLGVGAAGIWLMLTVALCGSAVAGERARWDYEHATKAAYEDLVTAMAGPEAQSRLDSLRKWTP